jgi:hypothetical protein
MIRDAFLAADKVMGISSAIRDPERYMQLTDCLLKQIEFSKDEELKGAREIVKRIRKRNLYKLAGEMLITSSGPICTANEILKYRGDRDLTEEDIIIDESKFNYAMKDKNPIDSVYFYNSMEKFKLEKDSVSLLIPGRFEERYVGIFVKNAEKLDDAKETFKTWAKETHKKITPQSKHSE